MKETGIIMSGSHPVDILEGRKTMTRRVIKPQPDTKPNVFWKWGRMSLAAKRLIKCPYGQVGDRLWVKETWKQVTIQPLGCEESTQLRYKADCSIEHPDTTYWAKWHSPFFMYRKFSRINLEITGLRVERLQEITTPDILAEGVILTEVKSANWTFTSAISDYAKLWDSLNAKRGFPWSSNPWVWVIEFKILQ